MELNRCWSKCELQISLIDSFKATDLQTVDSNRLIWAPRLYSFTKIRATCDCLVVLFIYLSCSTFFAIFFLFNLKL